MPLERRDVETALQKKGFVRSGGDHSFFTYYTQIGQKSSVWTKTSHGSSHKTLGDDLLSKMGKQCGLTKGQFTQLVECPLTQDVFEDMLLKSRRSIKVSPS
jgi:hypothetical protein